MAEKSFSELRRESVRDNLRREMFTKLSTIDRADYVCEWEPTKAIHAYGTKRECEDFAIDLGKRAMVREITSADRKKLELDVRKVYSRAAALEGTRI